jgi:hypothetical protein
MPGPTAARPLAPPTPRGMDFVRAAIAKSISDEPEGQASFAAARWGKDSVAHGLVKGPASAASTDDGLLGFNGAALEFVHAVLAESAVGKLRLRRRPPKTRYLTITGVAQGSWVGEGQSIPTLACTFQNAILGLKKVGSITPFTNELMRSADPAAELGIRDDLVAALAVELDRAFFDPANAGDDATPASITHDLAPFIIGGGDAEDVRDAIADVIEGFQGDLSRAVWVARPELFAMFHALGYRNIGLRGGELVGAPALATRGLPIVPGLYQLILVDPATIAFANDPSATAITTSRYATLQMSTTPTNASVTPTETTLVSMYQAGATAIRAIMYADWSVEQPGVSIMYAFPRVAS